MTTAADHLAPGPLLRPGETCWRTAKADRLAVIVDAADYFKVLKQAILQAEHSIMMLGWDFDARISLTCDARSQEPDKIGKLLSMAANHNPGLNIYLLKWDLGVFYTLGRGTTPLTILRWLLHPRIHYRLDRKHPPLSTHHQKIVVIDDRIAFCGGIDITAGRWDTRRHLDDDPRRVTPGGDLCDPWHDATVAVDGEAARTLGDLARQRWCYSTGQSLTAPINKPLSDGAADRWPHYLKPLARNVVVGISRTIPAYGEQTEVREIEALYIEAIARAQKTIYMESQYFSCRRIAEAIALRLAEPNGPEVVVVNPESADGWLEELAMDTARARLLQLVEKADVHDRFRLYYPVTDKGTSIYVHAKIVIIDDWMLRVGSSNLNNRSMAFDTECDLTLEVTAGMAGEHDVRRKIIELCHDLLAEHTGVTVNEFVATRGQGGLIAALDTLSPPDRKTGRGLRLLKVPELDGIAAALADSDLLDAERPPRLRQNMRRWLKRARRFR